MKSIWKYKLDASTVIKMPKDAQILTVQVQFDSPQLWALVDSSNETEERTFKVYGTGHSMPEDTRTYIGTFQICEGSLVFHVFEETQNETPK